MDEALPTPIYSPGGSLRKNATFIANINDTVSLWRCDKALRVYGDDGIGWWIHFDAYGPRLPYLKSDYHNRTDHTEYASDRIQANYDAVLAYAAMLGSYP